MMDKKTLDRTVAEARRFLAAVEALRAAESKPPTVAVVGEYTYPSPVGRERAACRRASMDLTRALADLRRYHR